MYVKPKAGLKVRDLVKKDHLPEQGREVPDEVYWHRRLRDGDVILADPPTADVAPTDPPGQPAANAVRKLLPPDAPAPAANS